MPTTQTPHAELGVAHDASPEAVRAAYKRRLLESHPDRPHGNAAAFRAVHAAYQALAQKDDDDQHHGKGGGGDSDGGSAEGSAVRVRASQAADRAADWVADTVAADDMTLDPDRDELYMPCRCGDDFQLPCAALDAGNPVVVQCSSCSLALRVEPPDREGGSS